MPFETEERQKRGHGMLWNDSKPLTPACLKLSHVGQDGPGVSAREDVNVGIVRLLPFPQLPVWFPRLLERSGIVLEALQTCSGGSRGVKFKLTHYQLSGSGSV